MANVGAPVLLLISKSGSIASQSHISEKHHFNILIRSMDTSQLCSES